jgi:hypothetical protein
MLAEGYVFIVLFAMKLQFGLTNNSATEYNFNSNNFTQQVVGLGVGKNILLRSYFFDLQPDKEVNEVDVTSESRLRLIVKSHK